MCENPNRRELKNIQMDMCVGLYMHKYMCERNKKGQQKQTVDERVMSG